MNMENKKSDKVIIETVDDAIKSPLDIYRQQVGVTTQKPRTIEDVKKRFNELLNSKAGDSFVMSGNRTSNNK